MVSIKGLISDMGKRLFQQNQSRKAQAGRMGVSCTCMLEIFWFGPALQFCCQSENKICWVNSQNVQH